MSNGMRVVWEKGERTTKMVSEHGKAPRPIRGKNGGPVVTQTVTKRYVPKGA